MHTVFLGRRCFNVGAVLAAAVLLAGPVWAQSDSEETVYRFSPINQYGIQLTAAYWNPIIAYVSNKSGVKLELKLGRTSVDTTAYVLAQEVEFVFSNHLFSRKREQLGWKVFSRRQTPPSHGQIIVPANSPILQVAQLDGKEIAFPGLEAPIPYKFPAAHLMAQKINAKFVFAGNMDAAFAQLFSGKVAAAGVNSLMAEAYTRREGKQYRVLWSSPALPDIPLMASSKVPEKTQKAVAQAFIGMYQDPVGRDILQKVSKQVGLSTEAYFVPSDGSEYAPYREFYRSAPAALR